MNMIKILCIKSISLQLLGFFLIDLYFRCIFTQPLCHEQDMTQGQFFKQGTSLNSDFFLQHQISYHGKRVQTAHLPSLFSIYI